MIGDNTTGGTTAEKPRLRLAVLVDTDNCSPSALKRVLSEIERLGDTPIRIMFGGTDEQQCQRWADLARQLRFHLVNHPATARGKNSTDIVLVVTAMDLLATGQADGFCIVSSDGDFTPLASRIRASNLPIYGFGSRHASSALRAACTKFVTIENLHPENPGNNPRSQRKPPVPADQVVPFLRMMIAGAAGEHGWVTLVELEQRLIEVQRDFDPRTYGFASLRALIKGLPRFRLLCTDDGVIWTATRGRHWKSPKDLPPETNVEGPA